MGDLRRKRKGVIARFVNWCRLSEAWKVYRILKEKDAALQWLISIKKNPQSQTPKPPPLNKFNHNELWVMVCKECFNTLASKCTSPNFWAFGVAKVFRELDLKITVNSGLFGTPNILLQSCCKISHWMVSKGCNFLSYVIWYWIRN